MSKIGLAAVIAMLAFGSACEMLGLGGHTDGPEITAEADQSLANGDLPGAHDAYVQLAADHPESVYVAMGLAYSHLLRGEYAQAKEVLARVDNENVPPEIAGELKLRRALVGLQKGDLDDVQKFGEASNLPIGKLLAAEVYLGDGDRSKAIPLFEDAASGSGTVADTAENYLTMLRSDDSNVQALAEATALWARGERSVACEAARDALANLPDDYDNRDGLALLWAGRAVTSGQTDHAVALLEEVSAPPEGQAWRVQATRALIHIANEEYDEGIDLFRALVEAEAPQDGLYDAMATAAALAKDQERAQEIAAGLESNAAARGLLKAGARDAARDAAPQGMFKQYLESN